MDEDHQNCQIFDCNQSIQCSTAGRTQVVKGLMGRHLRQRGHCNEDPATDTGKKLGESSSER